MTDRYTFSPREVNTFILVLVRGMHTGLGIRQSLVYSARSVPSLRVRPAKQSLLLEDLEETAPMYGLTKATTNTNFPDTHHGKDAATPVDTCIHNMNMRAC